MKNNYLLQFIALILLLYVRSQIFLNINPKVNQIQNEIYCLRFFVQSYLRWKHPLFPSSNIFFAHESKKSAKHIIRNSPCHAIQLCPCNIQHDFSSSIRISTFLFCARLHLMDRNEFYYPMFNNKNGILAFLNGFLLYFVTTSFV